MSQAMIVYKDTLGKQVRNRFEIAEFEDEIDFLQRLRFYLSSLIKADCMIQSVEIN